MTVKETEALLGIARANIRYYEQENLLKPVRQKNGYRDYSEQDIVCLKKIKLLRELGVSLADIKKLQNGERTLPEEMRRRIKALGQQDKEISRAKAVCMDICREEVSYQQLDADRYLNGTCISGRPGSTAWEFTCTQEPADAQGFTGTQEPAGMQGFAGMQEPATAGYLLEDVPEKIPPVQRYLARIFDMLLFQEIFICALSLCHRNYRLFLPLPATMGILQLLWLLLEPCCIHVTGTTIGKWIFGISLTDMDGRRLSLRAAFWRTFKVHFFGMGLHIPLFELYCMYKSYQKVSDGRKAAWDDEVEYLQKPSRFVNGFRRYPHTVSNVLCTIKIRYLFFAAACVASFILTYGCTLYAGAPSHRGNLTLGEFVENYNQIARYLGYTEYFYQLKPDGTFYTSKESYRLRAGQAKISGGVVLDMFGDYRMFDFSYSFDGEYLKQAALHIDLQDYDGESYIVTPRVPMAIAVQAFAGAQDGIRFWKNERGRMLERMLAGGFVEGFSGQLGGMDIVCEVECDGFANIMDYLTPGNKENRFLLEFTVGSKGASTE